MSNSSLSKEKPLAGLIGEIRSVNELTQEAFGQHFNPPVTQSTIARWENGEQIPDLIHLSKIAYFADLTEEQLVQLTQGIRLDTSNWKISKKALSPSREHIKILKRGVNYWNKWRKKNPNIIPEFCGLKLNDLSLDEINLEGADLRCVIFNNISLNKASLKDANLTQAELIEVYLENSDLSQANFSETTLKAVYFTDSKLYRANFYKSKINDVSFRYANLADANFKNSKIVRGAFRDAICNRVSFDNSVISKTIVYGASFWGSSFQNVKSDNIFISDNETSDLPIRNIEFSSVNYLERTNPDALKRLSQEIKLTKETLEITSILLNRYGSYCLPNTKVFFSNLETDERELPYLKIESTEGYLDIAFGNTFSRENSLEQIEFRRIFSKLGKSIHKNMDIVDLKTLKRILKKTEETQNSILKSFIPILFKVFELKKSNKINFGKYLATKKDEEIILKENNIELFGISYDEVEQLKLNISGAKTKVIRSNISSQHLSDFEKFLVEIIL